MLASLLSVPVIGAILRPLLSTLLDGYKAKLDNDSSGDMLIADLAKRELAVQQRELELQGDEKARIQGRWYAIENVAGYILVLYLASAVLWDKVIYVKFFLHQWGNTDAVKGETAVLLGLVASFWFGKKVVTNILDVVSQYIKK